MLQNSYYENTEFSSSEENNSPFLVKNILNISAENPENGYYGYSASVERYKEVNGAQWLWTVFSNLFLISLLQLVRKHITP